MPQIQKTSKRLASASPNIYIKQELLFWLHLKASKWITIFLNGYSSAPNIYFLFFQSKAYQYKILISQISYIY